jgi:hypothetical protein
MPYLESDQKRVPLKLTLKSNTPPPYPAQSQPQVQAQTQVRARPKRRWIRKEKIGPAFWTVAGILSLTVNLFLIILLISLGQQLFALKHLVQNQLLLGLSQNFAQMDEAHIRTTIPVTTTVPAKFDLPLSTTTMVTLTEDTRISGASILEFNAGELNIRRASTNIILPRGTRLPIELNLVVPVDEQIPVDLIVSVDIPLNETDLHKPFVGLQEVVNPYYNLLNTFPNSWEEVFCGPTPSNICQQFMH